MPDDTLTTSEVAHLAAILANESRLRIVYSLTEQDGQGHAELARSTQLAEPEFSTAINELLCSRVVEKRNMNGSVAYWLADSRLSTLLDAMLQWLTVTKDA